MRGELWSYVLLSLLFLGVGQLERYLSHQLQELSVLSLQFDDFRQCRLTFSLLGYPTIYRVLGDAMVFRSINDRNTFVLDAVDNLLLHVVSDAMLFHMPVC